MAQEVVRIRLALSILRLKNLGMPMNMERLLRNIYQQLRLVIILLNIISPCLSKEEVKSRQKRILWVTQDGRLALPPGTTLVISPSLSMPFVRYPPDGFFSNLTISLPFTIDFNKLGLTDNENPYGVLPPLLARSMGRAAGGILADYIGSMLNRRRGKRSPTDQPPKPHASAFHGGERALLYVALEELLENFGMNGRACLLRAICEVHAHPMTNFGLVGEMLKLFLSASKSPYAHMLNEYVEAENAGSGKLGGPGECWPYMKDCPKSLFMSKHNHYRDDSESNEIPDVEDLEDSLEKVTYNPLLRNM
ncbi:uncharacterized protein LOC108905034 [Anoplophora glabripennis]|uniref:uncharacterized protein LOC108905034 n=1 Tax=Anoplophora glabripennis TaxID=217634 RepID=UPI0008735F4E|nr:uncharacterized protein LOC108905034 [Anoplophora glabripennis]